MKKILFCVYIFIALTLFSLPVLAEDATYTPGTGILILPDVIGDGSTCWNNVNMQRGTGLEFTVTGATSQTCGSDTSEYTIYNSVTEIVSIPNVVVDGSTCYAVNMQKGTGLTFTVTGTTSQTCGGATTSLVLDTGQTTSCTETFGEDSDYTINPPEYTDNGNGTVTENVTGLMWQQEDDNIIRDWDIAVSYCSSLNLGGHSDWRMPDVTELAQIVHNDRYGPAIDTTYFPNTNSSDYWTSSTPDLLDGDDSSWAVDFDKGTSRYTGWSVMSYVRCVRP